MLTECILRFPEIGKTREIQNGDDAGAAQHTSAGRKLGITRGGEEKWEEEGKEMKEEQEEEAEQEEEEEGPLTQIEGYTFGVAGDGRWWKERRADGKKRNCSQRVYHRRGACVGRWSVRWWGDAVGGFPRQWEILLF